MTTTPRKIAMLASLAALGACEGRPTADSPLLPQGVRAEASPNAVEHWTARRGGYELTFYPGFVSRAVVEGPDGLPVELYRQGSSFRLPAGASRPAGWHQAALKGGPHGRDVALSVMDHANSIARITVALRVGGRGPVAGDTVEVLTLMDNAQTCPPNCGPGPGGGTLLSVSYAEPVESFGAPALALPAGRAAGYEVRVDPAFSSRAVLRTADGSGAEMMGAAKTGAVLSGQGTSSGRRTPFAEPPAEHQVQITGGPLGRDVTVRVRDPRRHVVRLEVEFHDGTSRLAGGEEVVVYGGAPGCSTGCD